MGLNNYQSASPSNAAGTSRWCVPRYRQLATIRNPDQERLINSLNLCSEADRFQTFVGDWPSGSTPPAKDMAAAGWFYLGNLDRTQCFSCGGVLRNWRRLDNPCTEHITHFPHCVMAQGRENNNIPDCEQQVLFVTSTRSEPIDVKKTKLSLMFPCSFPATASMILKKDRIKTFVDWNFTIAPPELLAAAGFFSLGVRDRTKCFQCNGGLQNWKQDDDPWVEHAKWYPTCEFLVHQRGPEFVQSIVAQFPNINRPMLTASSKIVQPTLRLQGARVPLIKSHFQPSFLESELQRTSLLANACPRPFDLCNSPEEKVNLQNSQITDLNNGSSNHEDPCNKTKISGNLSDDKNLIVKLQQLETEKLCKVCWNHDAVMVYVPCGHICCCMECTRALALCPMCRTRISKAIRTYKS